MLTCPGVAVRKPSIHFSPAVPAKNNRSFHWFMIGDKENRARSPAEDPPLRNSYCAKVQCFSKQLIINEILAEAAGVELFSVY
jgi:hypothetical protein